MQKDLYSAVRKKENLYRAWKQVLKNGIKSQSNETKKLVAKFNEDYAKHIESIQKKLRKNIYSFTPARGVPILRPDKDDRPIVVAPIRDRVVQRSILDVIQTIDSIKKYIDVPTSFGGIKKKQVRDAIQQVCQAIKSGSKYYICSDINNFFTRIPRLKVVTSITALLPDASLNRILDDASKTELENLIALGKKAELFPTYEIGVAQGCCLSPLFGNILLHDFDEKLNLIAEGTICLRYIDDFIILGRTPADVKKAFQKGRVILKGFNMHVYDPSDGTGKAHEGSVENRRLEYLGCSIDRFYVHPSKKSVNSLKKKIKEIINYNAKQLKAASGKSWNGKCSLLKTLEQVNNILMGWGNQYSFCNAKEFMRSIDKDVDRCMEEYFKEFRSCYKRFLTTSKLDIARKILGVHLLAESKSAPILPLK